MRKFISVLLCLVLCMSCLTSMTIAHASASYDEDDFRAAVALGLLPATYENGDADVTRGEFFAALATLSGVSETTQKAPFTDVPSSHPYYNGICAAYTLGFISGYGDGTLRPDDGLSVETAVRLLCYVAGGKGMLDKGRSVASMATAADISTHAEAIDPAPLTAGKAAELLINTGRTAVVSAEIVGTDGGEEYVFASQSVFERYMGIGCYVGLVIANDVSYLNENRALSEGQVIIGDKAFRAGSSGVDSLLGYTVTAYYVCKSGGLENTVLFAYADERHNKVLSIKATDSDGYQNGKLYYYEGERRRDVALDLTSIDMVYNNAVALVPQASDFDLDSGNITLVDNNNDGSYDVAIIYKYDTCVVDSVDIVEEVVYFKNSVSPADAGEAEKVYFVNTKGAECYLLELAEWDVLAVARSRDGKILSMVYSPDYIEGIIESYEYSEDAYVTIDGTTFMLSDSARINYGDAISSSLGDKGMFGISIDGKIACVNFDYYKTGKYGYLRAIAAEGALSKKVAMKYVDDVGETKISYLADRVKLNGNSLRLKDNVSTFTAITPQLMIYHINEEGFITEIDTAYTIDSDGAASGLGNESTESSLGLVYDGYKLNGATGLYENNKMLGYRSNGRIFGGKLAAASSAMVFRVPRDPASGDDEDYQVRPLNKCFSDKDDSRGFYFRAYTDSTSKIAVTMLLQYVDGLESSTKVDSDEAASVISKPLVCVYDSETGDYTYKMSVYMNGTFRQFVTRDMNVVDSVTLNGEPYKVGVGDVIQFETDLQNRVRGIKMVYSASNDKLQGRNNPTSSLYATFRIQLANVYRTDATNFITTTSVLKDSGQPLLSTLANLETKAFSSYNIVVYDSEYKEVNVGSSREIIGYVNSNYTDSSKVLIYENSARGRMMVLYR